MKSIIKYIFDQVAANHLPLDEAKTMIKKLQALDSNRNTEEKIAIIGMACRFPKASNPDEFWRNLNGGVNCIDDFPAERAQSCLELSDQSLIARILSGNPRDHKSREGARGGGAINYVKGGYIREIDQFDAAFFRITPKEAMFMDPLQRVFLEVAYEAMEDAGYGGQALYGAKAGVFVGKDHTNPTMYKYVTEPDEMQLTGSWTGILASRLSYLYNFRGPSMVIDTACSSGLVSIHEACRALNKNECEIAIAGGIHVQIFAEIKSDHRVMEMVESKDEYVRTFDKKASGTVWGEGAGALILKPLSKAIESGDHIYAVVAGSAINNDGASSGITAPNADAQKELLIKTWTEAGIDPETISYIEAHGTGTNLGDPIEIKGITSAFEEFTAKKQFCGIGSVKTNVGHLVAASGIASAIKVVLALKNKTIPPSINFETPNPYINFLHSPVYVNDQFRPWSSTQGAPRRAGINAFGFSGTNCHVILEEPPQLPVRAIHESPLQKDPIRHILTLSARNQNVLHELLQRYRTFFDQNTEADLGDICYTANTGRGHYAYRIALVVTSKEDAKQKIVRLIDIGPDTIREPGIYFGSYKIVSNYGSVRTKNELTENDRRQISSAANQKLKEYLATRAGLLPESIAELCRFYIQGADIAWDELYQDQHLRKVSLPTYPLERIKYWAGPNTLEIEGFQMDSKPIHPLLHKILADSLDQKIYGTEFTVEGQWVLSEHRVLDYYIVPGAAYLEMARVASLAYYKENPIELRDFLFVEPLVLEPGVKKEVHTILKKGPAYLDVTIASKTINRLGDERWTIHAQGKIAPLKHTALRLFNLAPLKAGLDPHRITLESGESSNFTFGTRWNNIVYAAAQNTQALIELKLPDEFQNDLLEYKIHPALMDQAMDAFSQKIEGMRLPLMYKKMTIYGPMPSRFYCHLRRKDQGTEALETIVIDATLMDESGQVFIEVEDYSLKRVKSRSFGENLKLQKEDAETFDYRFTWYEEARTPQLNTEEAPTNGCVLIFKDETGMADRIIEGLRTEERVLIEVETGSGYEQIGEHKFRIKGEEADYQKLVQALHGKKISQILHFMSIAKDTGRIESMAHLEEKQAKGLSSLFYLCRAFAGYHYSDEIDLVLIADHVNEVTKAEDKINPVSAAFFGLGKCIHPENEKLRCRVIDIDDHTAADIILAEILNPSPFYQVAYRHNQRFIEEFQVIEPQNEVDRADRDSIPIRTGGVYVITGGTGGIGLVIGKYLAGKAKLTIVLMNRTALPGRESWDEVLARNDDQKLCEQIRAIREMEQAGAEILIYAVDITEEKSLQLVLDDIRHKVGKINGVFHAAGVAGAGFIMNKDVRTFKNVIAPKVQGTWLLDRLTAADDLDFFILFSSIITITGAAGQNDYTAANAFLDSFAIYRNKQGKKTVSVNWPLWKNVGMAAEYGVTDENLIFKAISRTNALNTFENVLVRLSSRNMTGDSRIIRGELNYQMISAVNEVAPFRIEERITTAIQKQRADLSRNQAVSQERTFQKAAVIGIESVDEEKTVHIMAQIWARVLGLAEIDIHQSFYDMGGDSILAGQLFNEINREYPEVINISDVFTYPSVMELAGLIDQKGGLKRAGRADSGVPADLEIEPLPLQEYNPSGYYPVSSAQKRMYILHQIEGASLGYNMPLVLLVEGKLDRQRVEDTFRKLIERHESLRTTFDMVAGEPVQRIYQTIEFSITYLETDEERVRAIVNDFIQPFDLSKAPLIRVGLFKLSDTRHILIYDMSHIISDGLSEGILLNEFIEIYQGKELPKPRIQYKEFAVWQNKLLQSDRIKNQEKYWLKNLAGELPLLNLPLDYPRPALQSFEGDYVQFEIEPSLTQQINQLALENGATSFMLLLSAFYIFLFKYTGQEDIIIGSPVAGRSHSSLQKMIGVFINTLAMRNYPADVKTFSDFLAEVKENTLKAFDNQEYQFETLVESLNLKRDLSRNPVFDVMFVSRNVGVDNRESMGLSFIPMEMTNRASNFDLTLDAAEREGKFIFGVEYCAALFKRETILRFTGHYINILTAITANPTIKLGAIQFLSPQEKAQILQDFNDTQGEYPKDKLMYELFEAQAAQNPEGIALQFQNETLSYRELNEKANRLAWILRERGVKPNTPVAIMVNRSLEMIIGIIAILKAGGAYLPIDPEYPGERIKYMLEDSETGILLTQAELAPKVEFKGIRLDLNDRGLFEGERTGLPRINTAGDLAYIIYTSGSTGRPKGVMIEHRAVHNFIQGISQRIEFSAAKTILAITTISFDIFGLETLLALARGLKIVIASEEEQREPRLLHELILNHRIAMIQVTPSRLQSLLSDTHSRSCLENLTEIMIGGEALPDSLLSEVRKLTRAKIYNMYGPTETTIWSTVKDLTAESVVNIGTPIANTRIYIMNHDDQLQPIGVAGELCIAGDGLARGYLNRPELTAEKFIPNPFIGGFHVVETFHKSPPLAEQSLQHETSPRIYRTGDLARWLPGGNIEFLGRIDHQVKIRGYRIELGEIEAQLLKFEAVKETVVVSGEDQNGAKYLCAYFSASRELTVQDLREYLSGLLPDYMIPSYYVQLERLPLTPNGKIDRKALPEPKGRINTNTEYLAPRNDLEKKIAACFSEILQVERAGIHDNFFALGGDSLKALAMLSKIRQEIQVGLSLNDLFKWPNIEALASFITRELKLNPIKSHTNQGIVKGEAGLLPIQKHFFSRNFPDKHHWNLSMLFFSREKVDEPALVKAITKLVEHHDALRIVFMFDGATVRQYIRGLDEGELFSLKVFDYTNQASDPGVILKEIKAIHSSMDLAKGPLLKFGLFKTREGNHLLIAVHHLVADSVSMQFIIADLLSGYMQALQGKEIQLPLKTSSLLDFSKALYEYANDPKLLDELAYWEKFVTTPAPTFPRDSRSRTNLIRDSVYFQSILLTPNQTARLLKVSQQSSRDLQTLLLAGLGYTFMEWSHNPDIPVKLVGHGRENVFDDLDLTRTCGWISVDYPVVLKMDSAVDISRQVDRIAEILSQVPGNGRGHGILKFITPPEKRRFVEFKLIPEILFNFLGQIESEQTENHNPQPYTISPLSKFIGHDITMTYNTDRDFTFMIVLSIKEDALQIEINYHKYEYQESTITGIITAYAGYLRKIIDHYLDKGV